MQVSSVLRLLAALCVAVLALAAAGCGSDDEEQPGEDARVDGKAQPMKVLLSFPISIYWTPLVVAQEKGYFEDEGLDVDFEEVDGSGYVTQQIVSGNVDFGQASAGSDLTAYAKDPRVRIPYCAVPVSIYSIVVPEDSPIQSVSDLRGKTLGITEAGGGEEPTVNAALADADLEPGADIKVLPIGSAGAQSRDAIASGVVDAYASSYPDMAALRADGLELRDITPEKLQLIPGGCFISREDVLEDPAKFSLAVKYARAMAKGAVFAEAHRDAAYEIVCKAVPAECEDPEFAREYLETTIDLSGIDVGERFNTGTPYGVAPERGWELTARILTDSGVVEEDIDIQEAVASSKVKQLQKEMLEFDQAAIRNEEE